MAILGLSARTGTATKFVDRRIADGIGHPPRMTASVGRGRPARRRSAIARKARRPWRRERERRSATGAGGTADADCAVGSSGFGCRSARRRLLDRWRSASTASLSARAASGVTEVLGAIAHVPAPDQQPGAAANISASNVSVELFGPFQPRHAARCEGGAGTTRAPPAPPSHRRRRRRRSRCGWPRTPSGFDRPVAAGARGLRDCRPSRRRRRLRRPEARRSPRRGRSHARSRPLCCRPLRTPTQPARSTAPRAKQAARHVSASAQRSWSRLYPVLANDRAAAAVSSASRLRRA